MENKKIEKKHHKRWIGVLSGLIMASVITYTLIALLASHARTDTSIKIDSQWTVRVNQTVYNDTELDELYFPIVNKGDVVVLSTVLNSSKTDMKYLRFLSCHSAMKVYVDDTLVYTYGLDKLGKDELVGYGYHFIRLPELYNHKKLQIVLYVTENQAFSSISVPTLCNISTVISEMITTDRNQLFVGIFLLVFGICFLFMTAAMCGYSLRYLKLLQIALLSIMVGDWTICNYHLAQFFIPDLSFCTLIEFVSLYLTPIPFLLYFYDDMKKSKIRFMRYLYWILLLSMIIFDTCVFMLQAFNIVHIPASLKIFHIIGALIIIYSLSLMIQCLRKNKTIYRIQLTGIVMLIITAAVDLMRFNFEKYVPKYKNSDFGGILPLGVLLYIIMLLITFCIEISSIMYTMAKQEILLQQTLTDPLTNIGNRRACEEEFDRLDGMTKEIHYGIISLDLNGLKQVNDTLGHDCGDRLIQAFADCLKQAVNQNNLSVRMGGDEFMIVVRDIRKTPLNQVIDSLDHTISEYNKSAVQFQISAACGAASSTENPNARARDLYRIADQRMYENKKKYKQDTKKA